MYSFHPLRTAARTSAAVAAVLTFTLAAACTIQKDNLDSRFACTDYCTKKFECSGDNPTGDEKRECVTACRDTIENDCGNEHQAAVNDKMDECKDQSCGQFYTCMVFETAPECLGFVGE